jgi:endonuclease/exonuclease/phosphatase family metal-dependent hydrolase
MRLLTWNVAGRRGTKIAMQINRVLSRHADVVALQEITTGTSETWRSALGEAGYFVLDTCELLEVPYPGSITRKNANLLASLHPLEQLEGLDFPEPDQAAVAYPEKYVVGRTEIAGVAIDVHNAHLPPGSSRGIVKPHAFEAIRRRVDVPTPCPQILCGDFNTPRSETHDTITTWGSNHGRLRDMWDAAERSVLEHPRLRDVHRTLRSVDDAFPVSHVTRGGIRRYDHVYVNDDLTPTSCLYLTTWMTERLSDHAAVEVNLDLPA